MIRPLILKRRPSTVEAIQVTEDNIPDVAAWAGGIPLPHRGVGVYTDTRDFVVTDIGNWMVRDQFGAFYPVPDETIFSRFEAVVAVHAE